MSWDIVLLLISDSDSDWNLRISGLPTADCEIIGLSNLHLKHKRFLEGLLLSSDVPRAGRSLQIERTVLLDPWVSHEHRGTQSELVKAHKKLST